MVAFFSTKILSEERKKFLRFQVSALIATAVDFLMTIVLKEKGNIHYSLAVAGGATSGALTAFTLNRLWVFKAVRTRPVLQALKYLLVALGSILLNTAGTYLLTELFSLPYLVSKALVSLLIGFTYSYYFSKRFVFYA